MSDEKDESWVKSRSKRPGERHSPSMSLKGIAIVAVQDQYCDRGHLLNGAASAGVQVDQGTSEIRARSCESYRANNISVGVQLIRVFQLAIYKGQRELLQLPNHVKHHGRPQTEHFVMRSPDTSDVQNKGEVHEESREGP